MKKFDVDANDEFGNSQFIDDEKNVYCTCNEPEIEGNWENGYYCELCGKNMDTPEPDLDLEYEKNLDL